jgi:hypothetical protein
VTSTTTVLPLTLAVYTGALSHCEFSNSVRRKLNENLQGPVPEVIPRIQFTPLANDGHPQPQQDTQTVAKNVGVSRALRLHAPPSTVTDAASAFPPAEVAYFLVEIFFQYAQTNYSYLDEQSLRQKLDHFFSNPQPLGPVDASWLCTALAVFAIGTQFAHLSSTSSQGNVAQAETVESDSPAPDDDAALKFYHAAITLMPDVIALASIESVQAFLLLGVYTLPIDAGGLSFTFLGIAIKMAVQNGMHRKYHKGMDDRTVELRNRIWWTTYTLEKYTEGTQLCLRPLT